MARTADKAVRHFLIAALIVVTLLAAAIALAAVYVCGGHHNPLC